MMTNLNLTQFTVVPFFAFRTVYECSCARYVSASSTQLDKVGLENRKWAYHKLVLPSEYRSKATLSVRLLDRAKDLQGEEGRLFLFKQM
jgi:hypothetical protein